MLLFSENIQTLHERQAGVDHDRELACKNRQFFRFDLFVATEFRNTDFATLFRGLRDDDLFAAKQRAKFILETQAKEEMILSRRHECSRVGHVFHWPGQSYEVASTELGGGGVTVNGWKSDVQQCQNCDGVLGVHYGEAK